jgi:uncharacterized membrane protein YgaE (UPF0421/DUF939 family)
MIGITNTNVLCKYKSPLYICNMIIQAYALTLLTKEDALALQRELTVYFETTRAKDAPQLAEILRNLNLLK